MNQVIYVVYAWSDWPDSIWTSEELAQQRVDELLSDGCSAKFHIYLVNKPNGIL
jgi:hypothetical protein